MPTNTNVQKTTNLQAHGNFRVNFKGRAEAAVRAAAVVAYGLKSEYLPNGLEPGGVVIRAMLQDDSYRDKGGSRLATPEFKACVRAW